MKTTDELITVEQLFNKSLDTVWQAITNPSEMKQWYFENIPKFIAKVGFSTQFNVKAPSRDFLHIWLITEVIPKQKITYNWKFEDCNGSADVSFEIFEHDTKTVLRVTNNVIEDFDDDIPEFTRESCLNGWNYFIKERLASYLNDD